MKELFKYVENNDQYWCLWRPSLIKELNTFIDDMNLGLQQFSFENKVREGITYVNWLKTRFNLLVDENFTVMCPAFKFEITQPFTVKHHGWPQQIIEQQSIMEEWGIITLKEIAKKTKTNLYGLQFT